MGRLVCRRRQIDYPWKVDGFSERRLPVESSMASNIRFEFKVEAPGKVCPYDVRTRSLRRVQ